MTEPLSRDVVQARLVKLFPRVQFDSAMSNRLAASAVVAFLHAGAVIDDEAPNSRGVTLLRPSAVLWMSDEAERRNGPADREDWLQAVTRHRSDVEALHASWGVAHVPWYGDNTRESLRDETFSEWERVGAIRHDRTLPTTSSKPRWALTRSFAALFRADVSESEFEAMMKVWQEQNLTAGALLAVQARRGRLAHGQVEVSLPNGGLRLLEPGETSHIIKGVIEQFAPRVLAEPHVVLISQPGDKLYVADSRTLAAAGIAIQVSELLPDAILIDVGTKPAHIWFVEAVATDGAIDDARRSALSEWARRQGLSPEDCRFLTAFAARGGLPARRRLKDLARNSYAWFADEPGEVLEWRELPPG